jgi:hypothetical protein
LPVGWYEKGLWPGAECVTVYTILLYGTSDSLFSGANALGELN